MQALVCHHPQWISTIKYVVHCRVQQLCTGGSCQLMGCLFFLCVCLLQVLYVPDQDELAELAKLAPPPSSTEPPVTSSISSADSEITPTIITVEGVEGGEGEAGEGERVVGETEGETSAETADAHISILSKYISEDQVSLFVHVCLFTNCCVDYSVYFSMPGLCPW